MSVCMYCGKQIESGECCADCAAGLQNTEAAAAPAAAYPVQQPERKKTINGKIIAMLSVLGVFGIMTLVVGILFN